MDNSIKVIIDNQVARIILNRPQKLNSLSINLIDSLIQELKNIENNEEVKVIILLGEGKAFCAGGDLETMKSLSSTKDIVKYMEKASDLTKVMLNLNKYIISAVHGFASGAGFSIALASDFIVADRSAKFGLSFVNVGLIPDLGLLKLLSERLPIVLAKEWVVSGKVITAEEAYSKGLINRLAKKDLLEETIEFSKYLLNGPGLSNRFVKYMLNQGKDTNWDSTLMQENLIQSLLLQTDDHREGVQAFLEKRTPNFKGQ